MNHIISAIVLVLALQLGGNARMGGTAKIAGGHPAAAVVRCLSLILSSAPVR